MLNQGKLHRPGLDQPGSETGIWIELNKSLTFCQIRHFHIFRNVVQSGACHRFLRWLFTSLFWQMYFWQTSCKTNSYLCIHSTLIIYCTRYISKTNWIYKVLTASILSEETKFSVYENIVVKKHPKWEKARCEQMK